MHKSDEEFINDDAEENSDNANEDEDKGEKHDYKDDYEDYLAEPVRKKNKQEARYPHMKPSEPPRCVVCCSLALPYGAARPIRSHFRAPTPNTHAAKYVHSYAFTVLRMHSHNQPTNLEAVPTLPNRSAVRPA